MPSKIKHWGSYMQLLLKKSLAYSKYGGRVYNWKSPSCFTNWEIKIHRDGHTPGVFCNNNFSECVNAQKKTMKITKKIKSRGQNSSYSTVINWIGQIQGKKMLFSHCLIMESRAGFAYLHMDLGWHASCAVHPSWTPDPPLWGSGFLVSCLSCGEHPYDGWEASFAQNPPGNVLQPEKRCRGSWDRCSMSFHWMWLRSRWGRCIPDWCEAISSRRATELEEENQEGNELLHAQGDTGANIEPGAEWWRGQEGS